MTKTRLKNKLKKNSELYLLLLPSVVILGIFCYAPMYGVIIAFKEYSPFLGILGSPWAEMNGFEHFFNFVTSSEFKTVMRNTFVISAVSIVVNTPIPIFLALLVNEVRFKRYRQVFQTISYAPYFVSVVVLVGMCAAFMKTESGVVNLFLGLFKLGPVSYKLHEQWFLPAYVISGVWQGMGWWAIIYIGTLSNVDPALHEAAKIDGAGRVKRIVHINLPAIIPIATIMFILSVGNLLSVGFEKVYLMQTDLNNNSSEVISTYLYKRTFFARGNKPYSFGAAVGLFNTVINLILLFGANFISRRAGGQSLW